jgi:hypothetical protein
LKRAEEAMEILEAYDLVGTLRGAAELAGCDHETVAHYVEEREAAGGDWRRARRLTDNEKTVTTDHVCGIAVRNPQMMTQGPGPVAGQPPAGVGRCAPLTSAVGVLGCG